jgi:hypothetical protein
LRLGLLLASSRDPPRSDIDPSPFPAAGGVAKTFLPPSHFPRVTVSVFKKFPSDWVVHLKDYILHNKPHAPRSSLSLVPLEEQTLLEDEEVWMYLDCWDCWDTAFLLVSGSLVENHQT